MTPAPPRVSDHRAYWRDPPPERSARCAYWIARIEAGWRRNGRISALGYDDSAKYFGVYIWEWFNVLRPMLEREACEQCGGKGTIPHANALGGVTYPKCGACGGADDLKLLTTEDQLDRKLGELVRDGWEAASAPLAEMIVVAHGREWRVERHGRGDHCFIEGRRSPNHPGMHYRVNLALALVAEMKRLARQPILGHALKRF